MLSMPFKEGSATDTYIRLVSLRPGSYPQNFPSTPGNNTYTHWSQFIAHRAHLSPLAMTTSQCSSAVESAKPVTLPDNWQPGPGLFDIDPKCVDSLCDLTLPFDGQPSDQWNPTSMTAAQLATWAKELERALGRYSTRLSVER